MLKLRVTPGVQGNHKTSAKRTFAFSWIIIHEIHEIQTEDFTST